MLFGNYYDTILQIYKLRSNGVVFMRRWMEDFSYKMANFMQGRYGRDPLTRVLNVIVVILLVLSIIFPLRFLWYIGLAILIYSIYRMFSRNHAARVKELNVWLKIKDTVIGKCKLVKGMWKDRETHIYVKCPNCKTYIRLRKPPKGKNILINCPKCRNSFEKHT